MTMTDLLRTAPTTCFVLLGIFSLLIGSFLNVVIYRLPLMMDRREATSTAPNLNLCFPRSFCPHCKTTLPIWQNIPIFTYLINRGRCFSCHATISKRYLMVELLTLFSSLLMAYALGFSIALVGGLLFTWITICITFIDLEYQLIPDELNFSLLWLGLLFNLSAQFVPLSDAVLGAVAGYISLWIFIKLYEQITHKKAMGHGDFKLFSALGAWFGWEQLPILLFFASLAGAVVGISYLKITKKPSTTPIPFGPFLCWSGYIMLPLNQVLLNYWLGN